MAAGEPVLPTLEVIRQVLAHCAEEIAFTPTHVFPVAAIVLQLDGLLREEWKDQVELSPTLFDAYPKGFPPPPDVSNLASTSYKLIDDESPVRTQQCLACVLRPGESPCLTCQSSGVMPLNDSDSMLTVTCTNCNGSGFVRCTTCDGARKSVACTVRYVNDKPIRQRRVFVPQVHPALRPYLEAAIEPAAARLPRNPSSAAIARCARTSVRSRASIAVPGVFRAGSGRTSSPPCAPAGGRGA